MTMPASGNGELFLDLRQTGGAEEMARLFPPPAYFTARIDGALISDKAALMRALAAAFSFPAYFGGNWDALLDCLRSLPEEIPAKGYVLAVKNPELLLGSAPGERDVFNGVVADARFFLADNFKVPFTIIII